MDLVFEGHLDVSKDWPAQGCGWELGDMIYHRNMAGLYRRIHVDRVCEQKSMT